MTIAIQVQTCTAGEILPLLPAQIKETYGFAAHTATYRCPPPIAVGSTLCTETGDVLFTVVGHLFLPTGLPHASLCPLLKAQSTMKSEEMFDLQLIQKGVSLAWITLSDKGAQGLREDTAGPLIAETLGTALDIGYSQGFLLPDEPDLLRALLTSLALIDRYDIICTSGGTGLTTRDRTPETTERLLDRKLPGFAQAMMAKSLEKTPKAILSRACAGIIGESLVLNLPGSAKAVRENLEAVLPALDHTIQKLHNDPSDCGANA